ncbi:MAG: efflux RND transporter periplasmic adaptor subunit [Phocaeicola sp.]
MEKGNKRLVAIVSAALVLGGGFFYLYLSKEKNFDIDIPSLSLKSNESSKITATVLQPESISDELVSSGTITSDEMVDLVFETSGKVVSIFFKEGTFVRKGQLLASLNYASLQAELHKLEAGLELLESNIFRQKSLLTLEAISQGTYDALLTDKEKVLADIESVKANIDQKKLFAPFDGVIGLRNISEGSFATTGTPVAKLIKIKPVKLDFTYPEKYSDRITCGSEINFTVADESTPLAATVYATESFVDETQRERARATYPNTDGRLRPGQKVDVRMKFQEKENVLVIPSEALLQEVDGSFVYRYKSGIVEAVKVGTGIRTNDRVELKSGVAQGDTILTSGLMQVKPNMAVQLSSIY